MLQQYLEIVTDFQKWAKDQKRPIPCSSPFRKITERFSPKRKSTPSQKTAPQIAKQHTAAVPIQQQSPPQKQPILSQQKQVEQKPLPVVPPQQELKRNVTDLPENIQRLIPQHFKSTKPLIGPDLKEAVAKLFPYITIEATSLNNNPPSYLTQLPGILFFAFTNKEHPQSLYIEKLHQAVDTKLQKASLIFTPKAEDAARAIILSTLGTLSCIILAYSPETLPQKDQFLSFLGIDNTVSTPTPSPLVHAGTMHRAQLFTLELHPLVEEVQAKKDLWAYLGGLLK